MVFTNLGAHEKEAFFDLLDEYFSSRPDLLSSFGGNAGASPPSPSAANAGVSGLNQRAAASAVHRALATNPDATANLVSAGLRHGAQNSSSVKNSPFASAASDPKIANSIGRVAAASLSFQANHQQQQQQRNTPPPPPASRFTAPPPPPASRAPAPPALPRRSSSNVSPAQEEEQEEEQEPPPSRPPPRTRGSGAGGLVSGRSFGDVNTTSFKSGFISVKNGTANKSKAPPSVAPPLPPAFPKKANNFAPPPVRRVPSASHTPEPEPEPEPEEEEEEGEWAEALYDYNSGEKGDLVLRAHERVKIVAKDSDDWWSGEVDGRSGLFPASYVKMS